MNYTIKTYEEGFIPNQFDIGSQIYDPWPMGGQTRPEQLEASYNTEEFDPETRFYAFHDDKMVGFLTSAFKEEKDGKIYYFFEFPYVLPEHQPEVEQLLIDHALSALQDKGADILVARAGEYWGNSLLYAKKYGFVKKQDIARRGEINLSTVQPEDFGNRGIMTPYDPEKHLDQLAKMYADKFSSTEEQMKQSLQRWNKLQEGDAFKSPWDHTLTLLSHKVIVKDSKVLGRIVIMNHSNFAKSTANLSQLILPEPEKELVGGILAELVSVGQEHNKKTAILHTGLWGSFPDDTPFLDFNISFEMKLAFFEKEL